MDSAARFRKIVEGFKDRVYTLAVYTLNCREDAEDVSQEAFIRLWKHFDGIDEERVGGWLVRTTRNLCIDRIRARCAEAPHLLREASDEVIDRLPSDEGNPRDRLDLREEEDRIRQLIAELEEPYRGAVILREIEGRTYQEIAEILGQPIGLVKVHLHRGRRILRERLGRESSIHGA